MILVVVINRVRRAQHPIFGPGSADHVLTLDWTSHYNEGLVAGKTAQESKTTRYYTHRVFQVRRRSILIVRASSGVTGFHLDLIAAVAYTE